MKPRIESPWMFLDHRLPAAELPGNVQLRITSDAADLAAVRTIVAEAFEQIGMAAEETNRMLERPSRVFSPVTRFALATVDGEPAATAMVLLTGGMGGVYWVGTRPAYARCGLGSACTVAVANAAFDLGKPMVGLHATPMGRPIYERLGFERSPSWHRWYVVT